METNNNTEYECINIAPPFLKLVTSVLKWNIPFTLERFPSTFNLMDPEYNNESRLS